MSARTSFLEQIRTGKDVWQALYTSPYYSDSAGLPRFTVRLQLRPRPMHLRHLWVYLRTGFCGTTLDLICIGAALPRFTVLVCILEAFLGRYNCAAIISSATDAVTPSMGISGNGSVTYDEDTHLSSEP